VLTLTVLVSLGAGIERLVEKEFDQAELLTRIQVLPLHPRQAFGDTDEGELPTLTDKTIEQIKKMPHVVYVHPDLTTVIGAEIAGRPGLAKSEGLPLEALT